MPPAPIFKSKINLNELIKPSTLPLTSTLGAKGTPTEAASAQNVREKAEGATGDSTENASRIGWNKSQSIINNSTTGISSIFQAEKSSGAGPGIFLGSQGSGPGKNVQ